MHSADKNRLKAIDNLKNLFTKGDMSAVIPKALEVIKEYESAIGYNVLALAHKRLGNYALAQELYEKLLFSNPNNTVFLGNLGNIYNDIGKLDKAEECFKKSLAIEPKNFNILVSLGNVFVTNGELDEALLIFKSILKSDDEITNEQLDDINYRIGEIYRRKGQPFFDQAIQHYGRSAHALSSANRLELIYKVKDKTTYCEEQEKINRKGGSNSLLAAVQTHASIRYEMVDENLFCKDPFKYIYQSQLTFKEGFNDDLVESLLKIEASLSSTSQPLINNGYQTAGNFLLSDDPSVTIIKNIILKRIKNYRDRYESSKDGFIKKWPDNTLLHGWIINIKRGGSLDSHMHKLGWLSGSLYLKLKRPLHSNQGNIIFDLDGANYPKASKLFPSKEFSIEKGDIILFPSSLFHKTVPFESDESRITLAFDIKPVF